MLGKSFGKYIVMLSSLINISINLILAIYGFYEIGLKKTIFIFNLGKWIVSQNFYIHWGFLFDSLSISMTFVVLFIYFLVYIYSINYMYHDPHLIRFLSYLSLFTFFMLILITADNLIQLFLGWEGVGLCSYLLISFWYTRIQALKAAIKAMIINRIGDFGLFIGILLLLTKTYNLEFNVIYNIIPHLLFEHIFILNYKFNFINFTCFFLFIGVMGKSAQIGLHTWLPDAMEGPTPVSALIHAATMVTAGVFLLIRCSFIFEYAPIILIFITFIGALTSLFASIMGLLQNDIKKIIAYSTCSQLGYMIFTCGLSNYSLAFFHLSNHAFFKALLFLSAGNIIHNLSNEQDIRKMGGLLKLFPLTYASMFIGSLALMGFPFLTGFYSKDIILEFSYSNFTIISTFTYWLGSLAAFFTAAYSTRLLFLVFITKTNTYKKYILNYHVTNKIVSIILIILSLFSIFFGYITHDLYIGIGTNFFNDSIFVLPNKITLVDSEFIPFYIKNIPLIFTCFGIVCSLLINMNYSLFFTNFIIKNIFIYKMYNFINKKFYFDKIYNFFFAKNLLNFSYFITFKLIDKNILENFGPNLYNNFFFFFL